MSWALALTATFTMAVSYIDRQTLAVLAPVVTRTLAISDASYGWLLSAFSVAYLIGAPLAGRLIDSIGARRGLLGAVVVWSAVAALHAVVPGFATLFLLRIALGLAEAPSFPGAVQTVHRALPPADRARGMGILFTGSSFGAMLAPPIAVFLEARWGFRVAFLCTAAAGLIWVPVWLAVAWNPAARRVLDAREPRVTKRVSMRHLALHPAVLRGVAVVFASAPMMSFALNWASKYLVQAYGLTQSDVGRYLWIPPALYDIGAIGFGHFASVRARRRRNDGDPPRVLFAMAAVLTTSLALMPLGGTPLAAILIAGIALAGSGGLFALFTADVLARVPRFAVSTAGGIIASAQSIAYIVASPIIGRTVQTTGSYTWIIIGLGLWVIPGSVLWLLWSPPPLTEEDTGALTLPAEGSLE